MSDFEMTFKSSPYGWKCPALQKALKQIGALPAELGKIGALLTKEIEQNVSGRILNRRTGNLWKSWQWEVNVKDAGWQLIVGSDVVYARIHEFGGMTGRGHKTRIPARYYVSKAIVSTWTPINDLLANYMAKWFWV